MDRAHTLAPDVATVLMGLVAVVVATEFDLLIKVIGFTALVVGLAISIVRFLWDREDRLERKRRSRMPPRR